MMSSIDFENRVYQISREKLRRKRTIRNRIVASSSAVFCSCVVAVAVIAFKNDTRQKPDEAIREPNIIEETFNAENVNATTNQAGLGLTEEGATECNISREAFVDWKNKNDLVDVDYTPDDSVILCDENGAIMAYISLNEELISYDCISWKHFNTDAKKQLEKLLLY